MERPTLQDIIERAKARGMDIGSEPGPEPIEPEDLMGTYEVAKYLGWTTGQVSDYAAKSAAGMPAPIARLRCGRIWLRPQIEAWAERRSYLVSKEET